jgi:hypothetical protein
MTTKTEVLDALQMKIDEKRRHFADMAVQSRKRGYPALPKRTIQLNEVEDWINSIRDEDDPKFRKCSIKYDF